MFNHISSMYLLLDMATKNSVILAGICNQRGDITEARRGPRPASAPSPLFAASGRPATAAPDHFVVAVDEHGDEERPIRRRPRQPRSA